MKDILIFTIALILGSIGHMATDIYLPSLPHIVRDLETTDTLVKLTFSAYILSFCIVPLIVGPISDRIGRKKPILLGLVIALISTVLCAIANNITVLIFGRFLQGIGMGMIVSTARAILPDHFQNEKLARYFSYMTMGMALVLAIAPPLGGFIQDVSSWRMTFCVMAVYLVLVFTFISLRFKGKAPTSSKQGMGQYLNSYKELLSNSHFMCYGFCTVLTVMGIFGYLTASPFLYQNMVGLTATEYGLTALLLCGVVFVCGFINSRLIKTYKPTKILLAGSFLMSLSGLLFLLFDALSMVNLYTVLMPAMIFFMTMPISFANAGAIALKHVPGNYGAAAALLSSLQYLGGVLSSTVISVSDGNYLFVLGCGILLLGIFYFISLNLVQEARVPVTTT